MVDWRRRILMECAGITWPAIVFVPPIAAAMALAAVAREQWIEQGLWYVALSHPVIFVTESVFVAMVLLLGVLATIHATEPDKRGTGRIPALMLSWLLLLYPLQQVMTPTFRGLLMSAESSSIVWRVAFAIPLSLISASAIWGAACRAIWLVRTARSSGRPRSPLRMPEFRGWALLPASVLLGGVVLVSAAKPVPPPSAPNVLLVLIDTLRADHLGMYGYAARPVSENLDAFAKDSVVYEDAVSTAPWTTPAVAAILTSRYPRRLGYAEHPVYLPPCEVSVAEAFLNSGYRTHAITSNMFSSRGVGFSAGFESLDASLVAGQLDITSKELTDHAIEWMTWNHSSPFFLYVHYFDPHFAYRMHKQFDFDPDYRGPFRADLNHQQFTRLLADMTPTDLEYLEASYDSEIALTDREIGRLFAWLREKHLYDNTMIVVVADHGEAFDDRHDRYVGHASTVQEELLHVPLIVKNPGQRDAGRRVSTRVSTLDVAPTMLEAAGTHFPRTDAIDGRELGHDPAPDRLLISETRRDANLRAVYRGRWKLIADRDGKDEKLYDLETDPGELHDVAAANPDVLEDLDQALDAWEDSLGEASSVSARFSPAAVEKLKALGYWQ